MTWHPDHPTAGPWPPAYRQNEGREHEAVPRLGDAPTMVMPGPAVRGVPAPASFWSDSGRTGAAAGGTGVGAADAGGGIPRPPVADELYLSAHDFPGDRVRLGPHGPLGILLAGGLLADLALGRKLVVDVGEIRVTDEGPMLDPLAHRLIAATLADAEALRPVEDWLEAMGKVDAPPLPELIAQRLVDQGRLKPAHRRSAKVKYQPVNPTDADWPVNRIAYALDTKVPLEWHDRLLAGLLDAAGLARLILPAAPQESIDALRAQAGDLPEHLTGVVSGVRVLLSKRVYTGTR